MATAYAGVCLLALVAPFELSQPLVRLPGQSVTNLELALIVACGAWAIAALVRRDVAWWRQPIAAPWLAVLAAMAAAAALAPGDRANAIHMVGRLGMAFGVCLIAAQGVTGRARLERVLTLVVLSGAAAAVLAVLEYAGVRAVLHALRAFRPGISVVGAQMRATGPLQYPTIASMCFEVAFAFAIGLLTAQLDRGHRLNAAVLAALALLIAEAIVLTFTRAGMITVATTLAVVGLLRLRRNGWRDPGVAAVLVMSLGVGVEIVSSRSLDSLRLRATTEEQNAWYRASIRAPSAVALTTGAFATVPVTLVNVGRLTWDSSVDPPFRLSYHWLLPDADRVVRYEGLRTAFPAPVEPGDTVTLQARVRAPLDPGRYRLMWDVVQEGRLWFSTEIGATVITSGAEVSGAPLEPEQNREFPPLPRPAERPGRLVLWGAALRMVAAHPLFGVGPDNFRLMYGTYTGLRRADSRVHSNDMYLEVLAGGGLVGGAAFAWLLWAAAACFRRAGRAAWGSLGAAPLGIVAAGVAIGVHGLVDSFLSFTPTYILLGMTVGLAAACGQSAETYADAHRV
ncbi:MAG: O-antigen ligase family protein [Betaproteobacteria bacterium]